MGLDLPSEPEEPEEPDRLRDRATGRPQARDLPDPDERGRVYEAMRARVSAPDEIARYVSAETQEEARPGRSYWDEVPGFLGKAQEHRRRWPEGPQAAPDCSADPAGSFRSRGGFYLTPERHAETVAAIDRVHKAEPTITADMQAVERENRHGGWLAGLEFCRKGDARLKEKVAEKLEAEPSMAVTKAMREVADAIRFTYCFPPGNYTMGYHHIREQLTTRGYQMYYSENSWTKPEYKGINTRWVTAEGQRFEVQFHSPESFHAKHHVTHAAYEGIRDPTTSRAERRELHAFQREVCSRIQVPDDAADIPNYRREGF